MMPSLLSRLSWPVQSLLVCAAFLVVATRVVGDYGAGLDTENERHTASRKLVYIMGDADRLDGFYYKHDRYYGIAFELPLLLLERWMEGEDPRTIYLMRHLVTHLFFLAGGWCCSLLVYRLSNRRGLALVALLLFVLQPRLYAHSFFNSKDLPFLSMFMIALYLTHRAFRKETVGAFLLCGVSVGILTNLRIMGVMLYPAVLALRGLDLMRASRGGGQKHVLVTGAVFALAGPCTLYVLSPYLWTNPLEFATAVQTLAFHPALPRELFQGRLGNPHQLPWHYIPTWIGISTPPVTLVCGVLGVIVVIMHSIRAPRVALGNTDLRFRLLLVACLTLPVLAIVVLGSHMYEGWRQVYFLHAPLSCLAALGLQWAGGNEPARMAVVGYALVGLGVLVTGREMVRLHPHQQVYFNALVDRTTPEALRRSYVLDPWRTSCREGLVFLRRRYPATTVYIKAHPGLGVLLKTLPQADRERSVMAYTDETNPDAKIRCGKLLQRQKELSLENALYVRKVYNSTLLTVSALVTVPDRKQSLAYRTESYRGVRAGQLVQQAEFDLYRYRHSRRLGYAKEGCAASDREPRFFLHVVPVEETDLPAGRRRYGYDNLDFVFLDKGRWSDDKCWTTVVLPDYPIARIRTGQFTRSGRLWETERLWLAGES